jgi:hypothetical protein
MTTELASWDDFAKLAATVLGKMTIPPQYLFRGQPDSTWPLASSLNRHLPTGCPVETALRIEQRALLEFQAQAHLHTPQSDLPSDLSGASIRDWWTLMQHHGAPTRLLDWTASPYVAAYFAAQQHPDLPGAIYVAHPHTIGCSFSRLVPTGRDDIALFTVPTSPQSLYFFEPAKRTARLVAQQGHFSLTTNILGDHDALLAAASDPSTAPEPGILLRARWTIPASLKRTFIRHLRVMNVTAHSLFPGTDGLGRSVADIVTWLAVDS